MGKKLILFIYIIILSIVFASFFGFLHNQISYTISKEYFTEFKFLQFGAIKFSIDNPRYCAGLIGVASTWWFGLLIGLATGFFGLLMPNTKIMWKSAFGAIMRTLTITIITSIIGILVGKFLIANLNIDWNLPPELKDKQVFLTAGTMHSFSYVGGVIGLIYSIRYQLKIRKTHSLSSIT